MYSRPVVYSQPMVAVGMGQQLMPMIQTAPIPAEVPPGTPPGLEVLLPTNRIIIQQQVEFFEVITGINTNNRYNILDAWGRRMYFAAENSDACALFCLGDCRAWTILVYGVTGQMVMQGNRESSCFGACGNTVDVVAGRQRLGSIKQNMECCSASWDILDHAGRPVLRLQGPGCSILCPKCATMCEAEFPLLTLDGKKKDGGKKIGAITKHFGNFIQEMYTAADNFSVNFPINLDVRIKAVLLFATFMIDFMYYEDNPRQGGLA